MEFIDDSKRSRKCIFCEKPKEKDDRKNLILYRGKSCFVIMNRFPYSNGHLLIAPYRHVVNVEDLDKEESDELMELVKRCMAVLKKNSKPDGINVGMNVGKAAGAGFEHVHVHVLPRFFGDTNFMPALAEVRVIPQHLTRTFDQLKKNFRY